MSVAALIRNAVDEMTRAGGEPERWERALAAVGRGASGRGDVSEDHDRYLAEAYRGDLR